MLKLLKSRKPLIIALLGLVGPSGCATHAGTGALVGGAGGAGLGAAVSGGHPGGTLFGAAAGAITGAVIGNEIDRQDRDVEYRHVRDRFVGYDAWGRPVYERVVYRSYD